MLATQERIVSEVEYQCARESMELIQRLPLEAQRKFLNMLGSVHISWIVI